MNRDVTLLQTEKEFRPTNDLAALFGMSSFDAHRDGVDRCVVAACNFMVPAVFVACETAGRLLASGAFDWKSALCLGEPGIQQGILISISIIISLIFILIIGLILVFGNPKRTRQGRYTQSLI